LLDHINPAAGVSRWQNLYLLYFLLCVVSGFLCSTLFQVCSVRYLVFGRFVSVVLWRVFFGVLGVVEGKSLRCHGGGGLSRDAYQGVCEGQCAPCESMPQAWPQRYVPLNRSPAVDTTPSWSHIHFTSVLRCNRLYNADQTLRRLVSELRWNPEA